VIALDHLRQRRLVPGLDPADEIEVGRGGGLIRFIYARFGHGDSIL
jgi:hypothetical protein